MALKGKKGYSIETKTARFTLLRDGINLLETFGAFNDLVLFYFAVATTHPPDNVRVSDYYKLYEGLTVSQNAGEHPLLAETLK